MVKPMPEAYLELSRTTTIKLSCYIRVGSKCASTYIYIQVSPIEIKCKLSIFAVVLSELKEIS